MPSLVGILRAMFRHAFVHRHGRALALLAALTWALLPTLARAWVFIGVPVGVPPALAAVCSSAAAAGVATGPTAVAGTADVASPTLASTATLAHSLNACALCVLAATGAAPLARAPAAALQPTWRVWHQQARQREPAPAQPRAWLALPSRAPPAQA